LRSKGKETEEEFLPSGPWGGERNFLREPNIKTQTSVKAGFRAIEKRRSKSFEASTTRKRSRRVRPNQWIRSSGTFKAMAYSIDLKTLTARP
jgi:hypothetical protein